MLTVFKDMLRDHVQHGYGQDVPDMPYTDAPPKTPDEVQNLVQSIQKVRDKLASGSASTPIVKATRAKIAPVDAYALLQFRKGGMYLTDFTNRAFVETAKILFDNEEKYPPKDKDEKLFVDIRPPNVLDTTEHQVSSSRSMIANFNQNVKPCLGQPGFDFQIRSLSMKGQTFFDKNKCDPTVLKVSRVKYGYFYVVANWDQWNEIDEAMDNDIAFEYALNFFFPHDRASRDTPQPLTLEIPGHGSFDIDRSLEPALNVAVQQILATLMSSQTSRCPPEVFVHRKGEVFEQPESEEVGEMPRPPIIHQGKHLPPVPPFPQATPAGTANNMSSQANASGPFYCPLCDEEGEEDRAQYRTRHVRNLAP